MCRRIYMLKIMRTICPLSCIYVSIIFIYTPQQIHILYMNLKNNKLLTFCHHFVPSLTHCSNATWQCKYKDLVLLVGLAFSFFHLSLSFSGHTYSYHTPPFCMLSFTSIMFCTWQRGSAGVRDLLMSPTSSYSTLLYVTVCLSTVKSL